STGNRSRAASSRSASRWRMWVSSGSMRARCVATRRRTKGSTISARQPSRLDLYLTSLETGGRLAWRRAVGAWPERSARWRRGRGREGAEAAAEEVAEAAVLLGVGVGGRQVAAFEQAGDGLGVLAVALGFAAVDGFHGPGVAEDEGDVVFAAGVGEPVPAVHAL